MKTQSEFKETARDLIEDKSTKKSQDKTLEIDPRLRKILTSPSLIAYKKNIEAAKKMFL